VPTFDVVVCLHRLAEHTPTGRRPCGAIYPRTGDVLYLPAYRLHFFQGKKCSKFGVRLIRGYKSFELINMQNFPTHTESTKLLKA